MAGMLGKFIRPVRPLAMAYPPANFSWVSDSVAGFAFPYMKDNLDYLVNKGHITHIITLNDDKPEELSAFPSVYK